MCYILLLILNHKINMNVSPLVWKVELKVDWENWEVRYREVKGIYTDNTFSISI